MIRALILFGVSAACWGVTASPSAITVYMRQWGAWPNYASRPPVPTTITISGTGSWNMSRGGTLSTACGASNGYCFNAVNSVTTNCTGALPTGSGAATVYLCWNGLMTHEPAVGTHTGTLTIGDTVISITLVVYAAQPYSHWAYKAGYPSGCSTPTYFDTAAECTLTNERPTSTAFSIPSAGGTYVDPQFGHTVRRVTAAGQNIQYGALSAFNSDATMVLTSSTAGAVNAYTVATGTVAYSSIPSVNINFAAWSSTDPSVVWFMDGGTIKYRNLSTSTTTTAADYTSSSGGRPAMSSITMGGTVDITDDGWWAFRDAGSFSGYVCAVNLNGLTTGNQESKTFCASMSGLSLTDIDFTQVTQVDSESGKRYVVVIAAPSAHVWSVGESALTYEYAVPTSNAGDITAEPHSDIGQDEQGRQVFWWWWYDPYGSTYFNGSVQLNKGADMTRPVEEGGGLRIHAKTHPGNFTTDAHWGCTWRGVCVGTSYMESAGVVAKQIQSITAANPCQINSTSHGYSTSNSVQIGGAAGTGVSNMNGIHTVTVLNANAYTIPVDCSSGWSYTANSAHSAISAAPTAAPFRQEIMVSSLGRWTRRIATHRSKIYSGGDLNSYYPTPRTSISRDGRYVAYSSNMGVPEQPSVYVADVEFGSDTVMRVAVDPADTKAVLTYRIPVEFQGSATITISASQALTSPVVSASDGLTAQGRQYVATGLTADTQYYYRVSTVGFAHTGQFRTLPTLGGTGRLQISKGGGGSIGYGTTSSLGSSCTSPCDLSVTRGVLYHNASGNPEAVVVR